MNCCCHPRDVDSKLSGKSIFLSLCRQNASLSTIYCTTQTLQLNTLFPNIIFHSSQMLSIQCQLDMELHASSALYIAANSASVGIIQRSNRVQASCRQLGAQALQAASLYRACPGAAIPQAAADSKWTLRGASSPSPEPWASSDGAGLTKQPLRIPPSPAALQGLPAAASSSLPAAEPNLALFPSLREALRRSDARLHRDKGSGTVAASPANW
jgi:hypothetical protein